MRSDESGHGTNRRSRRERWWGDRGATNKSRARTKRGRETTKRGNSGLEDLLCGRGDEEDVFSRWEGRLGGCCGSGKGEMVVGGEGGRGLRSLKNSFK